jgi:metal-dependent amidase/aminoacylase/carboxypeptidase family protein
MSARPEVMSDDDLAAVYRNLHANPELSFQGTRTAAIVAERLAA